MEQYGESNYKNIYDYDNCNSGIEIRTEFNVTSYFVSGPADSTEAVERA